ncbi:MAG: SCO family protein [Fimbriimonadaceae bacterium]|nr:hypothetical protein [Fimbriimonadaceae bacterium]MCL4284342.1 SCO family protein [Fimbriimonadaceae bacterium]QOJ11156.1 MAG: SCO family protein [Chthonomonadaceae bacterium]
MTTRISHFGWTHLAGIALVCALPGVLLAQRGKTPITDKIGLDQNLGAQVPLSAEFLDESGKKVALGDYFKEKPVVLVPLFYGCKGSCLLIRDGVIKMLNAQKKIKPREDFEVVILSVHPKETPQMAADAKAFWMEVYKEDGFEDGFHFLSGRWDAIQSVTKPVGFRYVYDFETDELAHPAGIVVLTPQGRTSQYIFGVTYPAKIFMDSVSAAQSNQIGERSEELLFGCWKYDPKSGKYRIVVENVLKALGAATVLILGISIGFLSYKYRTAPAQKAENADEGGETAE